MRLLCYLFAFCFVSCYETPRDCKTFQTGMFYSKVVINNVTYKSTFVRTTDLQVETYNNKVDSSKIRWINNCEVVFKTINPKSKAEKKDIHLKILTTTDSSYTFEYSYVGEIKKQQGVAYRLKN